MYAFLLSTAVISVAELGDKSQLMAMTFAVRYRVRDAATRPAEQHRNSPLASIRRLSARVGNALIRR
jgi:putative Ca2+/H+ antiporter (TMEM165/GDT1 family)